MDHFFIVSVTKLLIFAGMLCMCSVRASHLWLIESKAFVTSILEVKLLFGLGLVYYLEKNIIIGLSDTCVHPYYSLFVHSFKVA